MSRKKGLDFLKFLCSFMVIFLHIDFSNALGLTEPVNRIAVPIFFMITGYFYSNTQENRKEIRQIKKIAKILLGANILFLLCGILEYLSQGDTVSYYMNKVFTFEKVCKFIFLNESPFKEHLWYLGAVLYVLAAMYVADKNTDRKKLYCIVPILLLANCALGRYSLLLFARDFGIGTSRNFIFSALPFFLIGDRLYRYRPQAKTPMVLPAVAVFSVLSASEMLILKKMNALGTGDMYISTPFLAVSLFLLALNYGDGFSGRLYDSCCFAGARLSLWIYILHPIFISTIDKGVKRAVTSNAVLHIYSYAQPFMVFAASAAAAWIIHISAVKLAAYKKR